MSNQKEIRNPYYDDAMLTCWSVIEITDLKIKNKLVLR